MHDIPFKNQKTSHSPSLFVLWGLLVFLFSSCMGTMTLPKGERMYRGAKIKVKYAKGIKKNESLGTALERAEKEPRPNKGLPGFRPGIFFYNIAQRRLKTEKKIGTDPLLLSEVSPIKTVELITNMANNHGYFETKTETKIKKKLFRRAKIKYTLYIDKQAHRIKNIDYPEPYTELRQRILATKPQRILKENDLYQLAQLRLERERVAKVLQQEGYYFFKGDYLFFRADTLKNSGFVNLSMELKPDTPEEAFHQYKLGTVQILVSNSPMWTPPEQGEHFLDERSQADLQMEKNMVEAQLIFESLKLEPDAFINPSDLEATYLRLNHLGIFKFIDLHPLPTTSGEADVLDLEIRLVPYKRYKADVGVSGLWTPNVQTGLEANASLRRRNNFLKGHGLKWTGSGAFYTLNEGLNGGSNGNRVQEWKSGIEYSIPRYRGYFLSKNQSKKGFMKQLLSLDYAGTGIDYAETDSLVGFGIRYHEFSSAWKMTWKNSLKPTLTHTFQPAEIGVQWTRFRPIAIQQAIEQEITDSGDPGLLAFAPVLQISPEYQLLYDNRLENHLHLSTYWQSKIRFTTSSLLYSKAIRDRIHAKSRLKLFLENDLRFFQKTTAHQTMVSRLLLRWGIPLSRGGQNFFSIQELYSIGGANSIRAFPLRGLGPGAADPSQVITSPLGVTSQLGNILLQGNLEYRYRFKPKWETAIFLDAGNIWNDRTGTNNQGGQFSFNTFYKEIALGTGLGLRFHLEFLIIRLDWGIRLHSPFLPEDERWVRPQLDKRSWWGGQTAVQFAFGHPF